MWKASEEMEARIVRLGVLVSGLGTQFIAGVVDLPSAPSLPRPPPTTQSLVLITTTSSPQSPNNTGSVCHTHTYTSLTQVRVVLYHLATLLFHLYHCAQSEGVRLGGCRKQQSTPHPEIVSISLPPLVAASHAPLLCAFPPIAACPFPPAFASAFVAAPLVSSQPLRCLGTVVQAGSASKRPPCTPPLPTQPKPLASPADDFWPGLLPLSCFSFLLEHIPS